MRSVQAIVLLTLAGCSQSPAPEERRGPPPAIPVEARIVEPRDVEYVVHAVGSIDAFESVQITARVAGVVEQVHFKQGDTVKKDAMLAEIEPNRYELAHQSSKAALDSVIASREEAQRELERMQKLAAEGVATGLDVSQWQTKLATAGAQESQARAALSLAALNVREARVRAPLTGIVQTRTVQTGQYVQAGAVLATLLQRDPLLLKFTITEQEAPRVRPDMVARFTVKEDSAEHQAKITFVAAAADPNSRMVPVVAEVSSDASPGGSENAGGAGHRDGKMRGAVPSSTNRDGDKSGDAPSPNSNGLRPGSFAEVNVPIETMSRAIVVPEAAVRPSERGFLAYVVEDGVARERVLTLGMRTRDGLVEVKRGISAGEIIVIRGAEALREGAKVQVKGGAARPPGDTVPAASSAQGRAGP